MFAIVDIETTGLSPEHDRITEVAIVHFDGTKVTGQTSFLINPECRIPHMIAQLTGITNEMVDPCPRFAHFAKQIIEATEGLTFVAHNARFDYSFLAAEFRRLGFVFRRPQLCTVRLGRRYLPGLSSYRLSNLCQALDIKQTSAHRALADASVTAQVLAKILEKSAIAPQNLIDDNSSEIRLPQHLKQADIDAIPNLTGVYYFYDSSGSQIYVGKSLRLKERILSHFAADLRDAKERKIKEQVARIDYVVTGSELVALLLESAEIKRLMPIYNRAQRRGRDLAGVFVRRYPHVPYHVIEVKGLQNQKDELEESPFRSFSSFSAAKAFLNDFITEHKLCSHFSNLGLTSSKVFRRRTGSCFAYQIENCLGACLEKESFDNYNLRLNDAIEAQSHLQSLGNSFVVSEAGRSKGEKAFVWVHQGIYQGYGYWNRELDGVFRAERAIKKGLEKRLADNSDVRRILNYYLSSSTRYKIHPLLDTAPPAQLGLAF